MKLIERTLVNLADSTSQNLLGHISLYEKSNGNLYYVYFIEAKYYAAKEVDPKTNNIIREEGSDNDYHYSVDILFNDKARQLGCPECLVLTL